MAEARLLRCCLKRRLNLLTLFFSAHPSFLACRVARRHACVRRSFCGRLQPGQALSQGLSPGTLVSKQAFGSGSIGSHSAPFFVGPQTHRRMTARQRSNCWKSSMVHSKALVSFSLSTLVGIRQCSSLTEVCVSHFHRRRARDRSFAADTGDLLAGPQGRDLARSHRSFASVVIVHPVLLTSVRWKRHRR